MESNFTNAEYFTLPSLGKVYDVPVVPEVQLKSMTTRHEMLRLSPSEDAYRTFCDILDDCIVNDIGISAYDLCLGDYQFLMYKLRTVTYGNEISMTARCPKCGKESNITLDIDSLNVENFNEDMLKYRTFTLPKSGNKISLRLQTPRLLDNTSAKIREMKNKINSDVDQTLLYTLISVIDTIDDKKPDIINLPGWLRDLPMLDTNTLLNYSGKYNSCIGVDTEFTYTCDYCGKESKTIFRINSEFFRPQINI